MKKNNNGSNQPQPVLFQEVIEKTKRWRNFWEELGVEDIDLLRGFCMPKDDLVTIIQELGEGDNVRFYFGKSAEGSPDFPYQMFALGVDKDGNDIFDPRGANSEIFDLSQPCPICCGTYNSINDFPPKIKPKVNQGTRNNA